MDYQINVGDYVSVHCYNGRMTISHKAEVKHIPTATGDSWIFVDSDTGQTHYISEGITVSQFVEEVIL